MHPQEQITPDIPMSGVLVSEQLQLLIANYPGQSVVDLPTVAKILDWHPASVRNAIRAGKFPIHSHKSSDSMQAPRYFKLTDVARYLEKVGHR
jgi:hypothetical protein